MAHPGTTVVIKGASPELATPELIGGKAAGLAVMANELLLPVPPAFAVTTAVCNDYLANGWRDEWTADIRAGLDAIARRVGRRFGDLGKPLLVSVRSGAAVSMPGMMDTLLNVGMTQAIRERLAEESGNPVFAADTWLRFNRMFAEIVLGGPGGEIAEHAMHDGSAAGMLGAADRIRSIARELGGIPTDPFDQLLAAIRAVFDSWQCDRAAAFRARENIRATIGTAATVQAMVFGNLDARSGTGVVFTRDPATGANKPYGDYLPGGQGEDVVSGSHRVAGLEALQSQLPGVYDKLLLCLQELELHYRDMCDVEFTVSEGKLYILQTRIGRRSPLAAVRIAVDMANDPAFPLTRDEAVARVDERTLQNWRGSAGSAKGRWRLAGARVIAGRWLRPALLRPRSRRRACRFRYAGRAREGGDFADRCARDDGRVGACHHTWRAGQPRGGGRAELGDPGGVQPGRRCVRR